MRTILVAVVGVALLAAGCGEATTTTTTTAGDDTTTIATTTTAGEASTTTAGEASTTTAAGTAVEVPEAWYCVTGITPDDTLNLRAGPGTNFADVGDLAFDTTSIGTTGVGAYDDQGGLWYEIYSGPNFATSWVASWFLAPDGSERCASSGDAGGYVGPQVTLNRDGLTVSGASYFRWSLQSGGAEPGYADEIVAAVTGQLGAPSFDSGWGPSAEGQSRSVRWGGTFTLFFSNDVGKSADYPGGLLCGEGGGRDGECFDGFKYFGDPGGISSEIPDITVGSTIEQLIAAVQSYEPLLALADPESSLGLSVEDLYQWVQLEPSAPWGLEVGSAEFGGTLCYLTDETGAQPPATDAEIVMIGTWCSP